MYFRLSVSNDLRHDADRDLRDIGAGKIDVHALNKVSILFSRDFFFYCCVVVLRPR